jgi:hypothetical protein
MWCTLLPLLKPVLWVQDALKTKEGTQVLAATSSEGAETNEAETPASQIYANDVTD